MQYLIEQYLTTKGLPHVTRGNEILTRCVFNDCDADSRDNEFHLSINHAKGAYRCFKCESGGHISELAEHLGDNPVELGFREIQTGLAHIAPTLKQTAKAIEQSLSDEQVNVWHDALPKNILAWLTADRGLTEPIISQAKLGWDGERVVIPIDALDSGWLFAKRRQPPGEGRAGPRYLYPKGAKAALYGARSLQGVNGHHCRR